MELSFWREWCYRAVFGMEGGLATAMVMVTAIATIMVILIAMTTIIMDTPMDIHIDIPIVTLIDTRPLLLGEIIITNQEIDPVISDEMKG